MKVFVYGTLKPGEANYDRYCAAKVMEKQCAIALGKLFALPMGYPAMTLGDTPVRGVLLNFADSAILHNLDELEGYDPNHPRSENEYYRQKIEIYNLFREPLATAWVYLMSQEQIYQRGGILLPDGLWSDRLL